MKTIDEQLNIINDTKEGIANVLNSKGVEVTEDTKFADYPDKVAMLMGAGEVQAEVDRNVAEVTEQYRQDLADVSEEVNGLKTTKADKSYVDEQLAGKLDASVAAETYQPKGAYLTEHQDISGKLDASVAAETYQPKGAYLTEHQSLDAYATKEYVGQQGFLTQHQDISGKLDASVAAETYQPKGAYLTEHQDISGKLDASVAADTYQPKGNYLTEHQSLDAYATKQYVGEQGFLTQHQDISGKLDASVAAETYQPKGAYLTEHQSLADYATKSEIPDVSNLLDASVAASTYATKSEVGGYEVVTVHGNEKGSNSQSGYVIKANKVVIDYNSETAISTGQYFDAQDGHNNRIVANMNKFLANYSMVTGYISGTTVNGTCTACTANEDLTQVHLEYTLDEAVTMTFDGAYSAKVFVEKGDAVTVQFIYEVGALGLIAGNMGEKLDASVAAATYQPKGTYLTEHQDISGKLDASVAADTYATKTELSNINVNDTVTQHTVYTDTQGQYSTPVPMTSLVMDFNNSDMAPEGYVETFNDIKDEVIRIMLQDYDYDDQPSVRVVSLILKYNDTEGCWYIRPEGGYAVARKGEMTSEEAAAYDAWWDANARQMAWFDRTVTWTPNPNEAFYTYYKANFTAVYEALTTGDYKYRMTFTFDRQRNIACDYNTSWFSEWRAMSVTRIFDETISMKQYVDGQLAGKQPVGNYLTEHQDISGKLDASVAAETYQPKGSYLTEHQSLANYATKADIDGGNHYAFNFDGKTPSVSLVGDTVKFTEVRFTWEDVNGNAQSSINSGANPVYINFSNGKSLIGSTSNFTVGTSSMNLTCDGQTAEVVSYSWDGSVLTQVSRFANPIEGTVSANGCGNFVAMHCSGSLDFPMTWKQYVDTNFLTEEQNIDHKLDASVAESTYALKADTIYSEGDVSTNHGATDDLSTTPVTFTCDKMKFTCEGGWNGMANTSEKSVGLTITCDEGTVKLIKLDGVFTLTTAYAWNSVTAANTLTTVKASNLTYNLNEITFNDKVTLTNVTAVTVSNFGSNVQMTTSEHVVTTVKQKIAALEALIAGYHPANNNPE